MSALPPPELAEAIARLRADRLVAFPTETVYGLGAAARSDAAIAALYALKGRPAAHPVIVHIASAAQLADWARDVPPLAHRLAAAFWPGPLTMILRRQPWVADALTGGQDTVGLRVPSHPVAQALLTAFGDGVAAPSANRFGRVSPTRASHVRAEFGADLLVLEGGDCEVGLESAIVDLSRLDATAGRPVLLRPGMLALRQLEQCVGAPVLTPGHADPAAPRAPGRLASHYAPRTPLHLVEPAQLTEWLATCCAERLRVAVFGRSADAPAPVVDVSWHDAPAAAPAYGSVLYRELRRLAVLVPPRAPEWAAIHDRLQRAAARAR
jgi:L-threonylcarbamoyladenylate synthase